MAIQKEKQVRFLKQRADLVIKSGGSLTIKKDGTTLEDVEIIELGENLTLTENPDGSVKIDSDGGISEYTQPITGLGTFVTHNLDRHLDPDQVVFNETDGSTLTVACENINASGNFSKNECKIISNTAMNGLLRLK